MERGSCDTCEERDGVIREGTELFCCTCYTKKMREDGDYDDRYIGL
tara:strand:+ start:787 stop:924 length:138 start_codon:yes stop_codon:yes gene_type:complete